MPLSVLTLVAFLRREGLSQRLCKNLRRALVMPLEEDIQTETSPGQRARREFRLFLANLAIALGWALKHSCKGCAHRLFTTARWLVPEAQRFLVYGSGLDHHRRIGALLAHKEARG